MHIMIHNNKLKQCLEYLTIVFNGHGFDTSSTYYK